MAKTPKTPGAFRVDRVEHLPMSKIKVGKRFRVSLGDVEELADSIERLGLIHPVVVTNEMELVVGGRRFAAHQLLKRETIRADIVYVNTKIAKLELELEENVSRMPMRWSEQAMLEKAIFDMRITQDPKWTQRDQAVLRDTAVSGVNMRLQLAEAMAPNLLPELADCETQDDAWKKFKKLEEVALVGHLRSQVPEHVANAPMWAKDHYVVGDALIELPSVSSQWADFAECDPPYAIELDRRKSRNKDEGHTDEYNEIKKEDFPAFMKTLCAETFRILKPNTFAVFWYGMQWHTETLKWLQDAGFAVNPMPAIWYKGQSGQTAQPDVALASCYEPFFLARKGQPKMMRQGRANVFHYQPLSPSRKIHPTEKPFDLMKDILDTILFPGSTVLIPFLGSGVTLRAAYAGGHTGRGFDMAQGNRERFLRVVADDLAAAQQDDENVLEDFEEFEG